ncbi:aldose 1-epimerase [Aestuariivivens sediminis]|uniref:aldose 1-epimerase n=1 Tax=Aestuariivivens sediminis TaxID=2913557 RepID=UPI001F5631EB|nr:aldose 1-epimerase [Aestuariivivens sediminis]
MYQIIHHKELNHLEVEHPGLKNRAKIYLNDGASLQEFQLNGHAIIQDLSPLTYESTYASSILFPFANRVKDGVYAYAGKNFQLDINQVEENNALHGLVYNKTFNLVDCKTTSDTAHITLEYIETTASKGFPYTFSIQLEYIFGIDSLDLGVHIKNTDQTAFPFTIGWHPYFISDNLYESSIQFNSTQKIILGERNITTGVAETRTNLPLLIKGQQLDDCWRLNSDEVLFRTPKYNLQFNASGTNNFLQIYTPPKNNAIAIEPTTGISDSFNNKIGLQELQPNELYSITWSLRINENN